MTMTKAQKIKKLKRQKPGLYRNINLKKLGAGKTKKTRKPGQKGMKSYGGMKKKKKKTKKK